MNLESTIHIEDEEVESGDVIRRRISECVDQLKKQASGIGSSEEQPAGCSFLLGLPDGWERIAIPENLPMPDNLVVVSEDGFFPVSGRLMPGSPCAGLRTIWYRAENGFNSSGVQASITAVGEATLTLNLGITLFNPDRGWQDDSDLTALGLTVGELRRINGKLVTELRRSMKDAGWEQTGSI